VDVVARDGDVRGSVLDHFDSVQVLSNEPEAARRRAPPGAYIEHALKIVFGEDLGEAEMREFEQLVEDLVSEGHAQSRAGITRIRFDLDAHISALALEMPLVDGFAFHAKGVVMSGRLREAHCSPHDSSQRWPLLHCCKVRGGRAGI
jgi:hypothetical protein